MALILVGIGIIACVLLSGLFSAAEMAISSANLLRLHNEAEDGNRRAKRVIELNENYDDTLSAILLSNNLVNIAASSLSTVYIIMLTGADDLNWLITAIVTILIIIFGESIPKILSKRYSNAIAKGVSGFIKLLIYIFMPINAIVVGVTNLITGKLSEDNQDNHEEEAVEELQAIIETAEDEGVIDADQSEIVAAAIDFSEVTASDAMTARVDVEAIDVNAPISKIKKKIISSSRSRMPVYEGSIDNVIGVVHLNTLLKALATEAKPDIKELMYEPCFVYKTAKLPHVLSILKESHVHLAIVTDEYSGTCGVISLEDVLEEIVGEIWDETDEIEEEVVEEDGQLTVDGDMLIDDFLELLNIDADEFNYESQTAGGFCIEYMDDFPKEGDSFEYGNWKFTIAEAGVRRVEKVVVSQI